MMTLLFSARISLESRPAWHRLAQGGVMAALISGAGCGGGDPPRDSGASTEGDGAPRDSGASTDAGAAADGEDAALPAADVRFQRIQLTDRFYAEGASFGDFDNDGVLDIVSGPFWYEGPAFTVRHTIYNPVEFNPRGYSDNFFAFVHDFNADGRQDVLFIGFPGQDASWYENPADSDGAWVRHRVFEGVASESPTFTDLTGDGLPELVCAHQGRYGFAAPNWELPSAPWVFRPLSSVGPYENFTHGLGVGDLDGDGRKDLLEVGGAWLQPAGSDAAVWPFRSHSFGHGGAQMFAYDVDGDGDADVVTTLAAHGYGVAWYEQRSGSGGAPQFIEHVITDGASNGGTPLHEPHALDLADVNGDGVLDVITGERFWGHVPEGNPDFDAPAHLYWFELKRQSGGIRFVPHLIDDASGVGTQVVAGDINGDGLTDIVTANKKGLFVFLQERITADGGSP